MSSQAEETEVLRALYQGSAGGFDAALAALAAATRAQGALLALPEARWTQGTPPALPAAPGLREGRVYAQGDLGGEAPLRLVAAKGAVLAIHRRHEDFRAADAALLSRLAPHLETAATLWRQRQAEGARAARMARMAVGLGGGWLLLDAALRVIDASEGARLDLTPETTRALRRGVDQAQRGQPAVVVLSIQPRIEAALHAEGPLTLALLRRAPDAGALPHLAEALGLTRAEARLAAALADGATLSEAAGALGWSEQTARSTSKQVFSKLGVSGQPALVRRVLNGAHWWMPQGARPLERT